MKLKKCMRCGKYTLENECPICREKTKEAHYKFISFLQSDLKKEAK